ncbi:helix-turn-helix domain-containing protein [Leptospira fluminis]|uniref:Helix-turn-helix domain-containing protein n=1 Tax=Leptospira fluminis TaxID=2484979 RepID=A0A4R9GQV1_9LEPT|nr:helix-turn-helix domain-containing protein [Leptospira fluminis]TGK18735.1 helix-turn-helix domain-containing protein [Leptospira fluminis]
MNVAILLLRDSPASVITGLFEFFEIAGIDLRYRRSRRRCNVFTAAVDSSTVRLHGRVTIEPDFVGRLNEPCDVVIVPAIGPEVTNVANRFGMEIEWLKDVARKEIRIASVCSGAFLLASAGLLDGRAATTHWLFASVFRRMFPHVNLNVDRLVIDTGQFLTSGGSNAFYDLALHLIEQSFNREVAVSCARHFLLDTERISQTPFMAFSAQKHHKDESIAAAQSILEKEFATPISMEALAHRIGLSPRTFKRRFKSATGDAPSVYQQRLRIEWARKRLSESGDSVEEVCYAVGYENLGFFRALFKRHTGYTPFEYKRRLAKNVEGKGR